jgi:hypothetical protein
VTEDIKAVVDAFGGKPMCTLIGGGHERIVVISTTAGALRL